MIDWFVQLSSHAADLVTIGDFQDLSIAFLVVFLTEFGIPFPLVQDTFLFLLGYNIQIVWLRTIIVVLILLASRIAGSTVIYLLSYSLGNRILVRLSKRFPSMQRNMDKVIKKLHMKQAFTVAIGRLTAQSAITTSAFVFKAPMTIALARLTPGLLTAISVASGSLRFRYRYFILGVGMASLFSDSTEILLGAISGYGFRQLNSLPPSVLLIIGISINFFVLWLIQRIIWKKQGTAKLIND